MRAIDADALQLAIVEEGQANKRKKYIIGDIWELTGAEIREVINSQPTIHPELGTNLAEVGTDCISREQAIEAINDIASELHERGRLDEEYIASWCAEKVEQLPPIQPDNGLQSLAEEIATFKRCAKSENSDYLTGYLCALSVVEGMIADMRGERK